MKIRFSTTRIIPCLLLAGGLSGSLLRADSAAFRRHFQYLSRFPNRLAGSERDRQVRDYIIRNLRAAGINKIIVQPFEVTRPIYRASDCFMTVEGRKFQIYPVRANVVQPSITPPAGLSAPAVYLGRGDSITGNSERLEGKIVLLDYDCGMNWHRAFVMYR